MLEGVFPAARGLGRWAVQGYGYNHSSILEFYYSKRLTQCPNRANPTNR